MKKSISFLLSFAISLTAWAKPQTQSVRIGDLVNASQTQNAFTQYIKERPEFMKTELRFQKVNNDTIVIHHKNKKVTLQRLAQDQFKLNGKLVKIEKNDSPEVLFQKIDAAYQSSQHHVSFLEMLFFGTAHAEPVTIALGWLIFGAMATFGLGWWLGGRNMYRRITQPAPMYYQPMRLAPVAEVGTETTVETRQSTAVGQNGVFVGQ